MSLELDLRNTSPFVVQQNDENYKYSYGETPDQQAKPTDLPFQPTQQDTKRYPLRPVTLVLSILLALITVLAIVAASVGGSLAAKRSNQYVLVLDNRDNFKLKRDRNVDVADSDLPQSSNFSCPPTNCSSPASNNSILQPSSDCEKLGSRYVSTHTQAQFKPLCGINLFGSDMLGIYVYFFEDCLEACASFNFYWKGSATCYGVTYNFIVPSPRPQGGGGNCYLKDTPNITQTPLDSSYSATLM